NHEPRNTNRFRIRQEADFRGFVPRRSAKNADDFGGVVFQNRDTGGLADLPTPPTLTSPAARGGSLVELADDAARCSLVQERQEGMNDRGTARQEQSSGEPGRESHMAEIGLLDRGGMFDEELGDTRCHAGIPVDAERRAY